MVYGFVFSYSFIDVYCWGFQDKRILEMLKWKAIMFILFLGIVKISRFQFRWLLFWQL